MKTDTDKTINKLVISEPIVVQSLGRINRVKRK